MTLVREYAARNSEPAFETLVRRHVSLVYSVALRQAGNPAQAEEITQAVFLILARKAARLRPDTVLAGWLHETARFASASFLRGEQRRRHREQEAYMQSKLQESSADPAWEQLAPLLDEAIGQLGKVDRNAVVLRFFQDKSVREIAAALNVHESAAQKRLNRAVEKLRAYFLKRGVAISTGALTGAISVNSIQDTPAHLAASVMAVSAKGAVVSSSTLTLIKGALKLMAWTKAKTAVVVAAGIILAAGTTTVVVKTVHSAQEKAKESRAAELFKTFVAEKRAQVVAAAAAEGKQMPPEYDAFFAAAEKGDLPKMLVKFNGLGSPSPLTEASWEAAYETYLAFEMFSFWDEKYALAYSRDIIESIPSGSVYFTGVAMGGQLIPAMQKSQVNGDPCFTLSLFQLCEESYRTYLRSMYGDKIHVPTEAEAQKCFQNYAPDALLRNQQNQLKRQDLQSIDMLIAKVIFDNNPDREFYYEEGLPIEWMYPYLEPHGLILKINRQPLSRLSDDVVAQDHDFWVKQLQPMIGDWLTYDTPVKELAAWMERVRLKQDFSGFTGDRHFIEDTDGGTGGEQQIYSKLRTAIGGVYAWRADHATDPAEKERMTREADFAFRQAFALWPCSPESHSTARRYVALLEKENRSADARLIRDVGGRCFAKFNQKNRN